MSKMRTELIGIAGYAGVGKTTYARTLAEEWRMKHPPQEMVVVASFAYDIKLQEREYCHKKWGINPYTFDPEEKDIIRPHLVKVGCEARKKNPDHWIEKLEARILWDRTAMIIIDDVRFGNEAQWILDRGGKVKYIHRPAVGWANDEERDGIKDVLELPYVEIVKFEDIEYER